MNRSEARNSHPHEQFSLLLSGRMLLTVGSETREIGPGEGWYVPGDVLAELAEDYGD